MFNGGSVFAIGGAVGVVFGIIGLLFALIGILLGVFTLRRVRAANRALTGGVSAEAQVLETYITRDTDGGSRRHVILGFRTEDGRDIRVNDVSGRPRITGDIVLVRYLPERPEGAVPADTSRSGMSVAVVAVLIFSTIFTLGGLMFAAVGFGIGWFSGHVPPMPPMGPVDPSGL